MPFNKTALSAAIKAQLIALRDNTDDPDAAAQDLADVIANNVATQVQAMFADAVIAHVPALSNGAGPVVGTIATTITITVV